MIIIRLQGGLGNQMFQYALGSIIAVKTKSKLLIDDSFFFNQEKTDGYTPRNFELSIFQNKYNIANAKVINRFNAMLFIDKVKKKLKLNYPKKFIEPNFYFSKDVLEVKSPVYLEGYYQSYKYYFGYESFINNLFKFQKTLLDTNNQQVYRKIKDSKSSVSVHIRRGDYVSDKQISSFHGVCNVGYYLKAIEYILFYKKEITLFFFSDEIDWVKEQFANLEYNKVFVESNNGSDSWKDMFLMSECKHNIIANSSFSWWAAWLNRYEDKIVIAPKQWFNNNINTEDLVPKEWIRM